MCPYLAARFGASHLPSHGPSQLLCTGSRFSEGGRCPWFLLVPDPISVNIKPSSTLWPGAECVSSVYACVPGHVVQQKSSYVEAPDAFPAVCPLSTLDCAKTPGAWLAPGWWPRAGPEIGGGSGTSRSSRCCVLSALFAFIHANSELFRQRGSPPSPKKCPEQFWYFLSPQLSRGLWCYCDFKILRLQVGRFS